MALYDLVVQYVDKINLDSEKLNTKHPKRGDVIDYLPAGSFLWKDSFPGEHDFWRVIRTDLDPTDLEILKLPEPGDRKTDLYLQFRAYYIDLDSLSADLKAQLDANPGANKAISIPANPVLAVKTQRPKYIAQIDIGNP